MKTGVLNHGIRARRHLVPHRDRPSREGMACARDKNCVAAGSRSSSVLA